MATIIKVKLNEIPSVQPIIEELLNNLFYVENYKTDIIYDIEKIKQTAKTNDYKVLWIGYRKFGVDHTEFIFNQIEEYPNIKYLENYYRKIFRIEFNNDGFTRCATLEESSIFDFIKEYKNELNECVVFPH
jgi:hypothetical protein